MMKVRVVAVGKLKLKPIRELVNDYFSRITHYLPIELIDIKEEKNILNSIGPDDYLIICDEHGQRKTSAEFAKFIASLKTQHIKNTVFFIGGPDGISKKIKSMAKFLLSFSSMTLPHEMAQVILLEQIYRACTILAGEAYHRSP